MKLLAALALKACATASAAAPKWHQLETYTFEQYLVDFNKQYPVSGLASRRSLFDKQLQSVRQHNAGTSTYKQGVNKFTDMTPSEFQMHKGAKRSARPMSINEISHNELLQTIKAGDYADEIDWRKEGVTTPVKNQGGCGSCWAFSGTEVLETHVAIQTGKLIEMAPQEFVSCMPNPDECGGTGGCEGATQWLLFDYAAQNGMTTEESYPYTARDSQCKTPEPVANITGYVRLPTNDYDALMAATQLSSVAITVSASWGAYESGVFNDVDACGFELDHGVVVEGYGTDSTSGEEYWLVRNSWGTSWGEDGYIRLLRNGEDTVGTDTNPADGVACKPYPETQEVKGICGMLSDSSYATGGYLL
ncbi:hypothetical protein TL16_g10305 [Triparma laevis f. inornata]|uniref:Uncharacterized protein n=1 Tax=Triparma laevis f. inornata TaxID=1714386 RepID=A0A9W7BFA9_9STRA|nr:hypothetical protein TL16_g10305 [Triparma laevis f. inornata]